LKIDRSLRAALAALPLAAAAGPALSAGDAARGKDLYETYCTTCHSPDRNRVGPAHQGVFGRKAGTAAAYAYSPALAASGVTWTEGSLDRWLADPEKVIPGQRMGYSVADAAERQDLIAYLKTLSR
jgi:cytochrome c